jgi:DNA-binding transcriptional MerR regulator
MDIQKDKLTIQEVAQATGLTPHTLRYYERIGLIHPINREENTRRRYTADDVGWIDFLLKLRRACPSRICKDARSNDRAIVLPT